MTVYVIGCEGSNLVKIGWATDTARRCAEIGRMSAHPVKVLWESGPEHGVVTEKRLHRFFRDRRAHGEWFDFGADDPVRLIKAAIRSPEVTGLDRVEHAPAKRPLRSRQRPSGNDVTAAVPAEQPPPEIHLPWETRACRLLEVAEVRPPSNVLVVCNLSADSDVVMRRWLTSLNGRPMELCWSYYPVEIAAGTPLAAQNIIFGDTRQILTELGYPPQRVKDRFIFRPPTSEELETLDLPDDVPVIHQRRVVYSKRDQPVEVSIAVRGGHLHMLEFKGVIPEGVIRDPALC